MDFATEAHQAMPAMMSVLFTEVAVTDFVSKRDCSCRDYHHHHHHQVIYSAPTTNVGRQCITMSDIKIVKIKIVTC